MTSDAHADLLEVCAQHMATRLDDGEDRALRGWWHDEGARAGGLAAALLAQPDAEWGRAIVDHPAHRHPWYDQLAGDASVEEFAAFLLENRAFPPFLPLVERTLGAQICDEGRAAVRDNIADEQHPVPHAELMRRLIQAVKARVGDGVPLESYPSLVDRTLVFYYGYYCDPWHLVGSLYATELMAHHRMAQMGAGLERLGFTADELAFIHVHLACDDDHAQDWHARVIAPAMRLNPSLGPRMAEGIAACLDTSGRYLDDLSRRATARAGAAAAAAGQTPHPPAPLSPGTSGDGVVRRMSQA